MWYDSGIESLDPETGKIYWEVPWRPDRTTTITNPVQAGSLLLFSGYYHGTQVFTLDEDKPGVEVLWKSKSESETVTDAIHSIQSTPVIVGDYIYGIDSHGELRCVELKTGERVWATQAVTRDRALWASAHLVRNGDRFFINNDFGELIIAKLDPAGYHEISRTPLITPTTKLQLPKEPSLRQKPFLINRAGSKKNAAMVARARRPPPRRIQECQRRALAPGHPQNVIMDAELGEPASYDAGRGLPGVVARAERVVLTGGGIPVEQIVEVELPLDANPLHGEGLAHPQIQLMEPFAIQGAWRAPAAPSRSARYPRWDAPARSPPTRAPTSSPELSGPGRL